MRDGGNKEVQSGIGWMMTKDRGLRMGNKNGWNDWHPYSNRILIHGLQSCELLSQNERKVTIGDI